MRSSEGLYRDPQRGKIAGVCAGIAEYFGLETWLVRILVVTGLLLGGGGFIVVSYIAAWFILEKRPSNMETHTINQTKAEFKSKGWSNSAKEQTKVEVKAKVWQSGEPPRKAFFDIKKQFTRNEFRLRQLETYVTSSEFQLKREFNKL